MLGHSESMNMQILCLPYIGEVFSMIIMLPNDIGDLAQVSSKSLHLKTLSFS